MSADTESDESVFWYFSVLWPEMRMKIIDSMEPKDRCRYAACSHFSWEEARNSKEFIYEMRFYAYSEHCLIIEIWFNKYNETEKKREGIKLKFEKRSGSTHIIYYNLYDKELYKIELDNSTNLIQLTVDHFKSKLQFYQNTVKKLVFKGELFETVLNNYDFGLTSMTNLEVLEVCDGIDFRQLTSLIRFPLKEFQYFGHASSIVTNCQQIYQVQYRVGVSHTTFTNEQFCQLSAMQIQMPIGNMTEYNVANFITSWQNGKLREKFQSCYWDLLGWRFDVSKLLRLVQLEAASEDDDFDRVLKTANGRVAMLRYNNDHFYDVKSLFFKVENNNRNQQ